MTVFAFFEELESDYDICGEAHFPIAAVFSSFDVAIKAFQERYPKAENLQFVPIPKHWNVVQEWNVLFTEDGMEVNDFVLREFELVV